MILGPAPLGSRGRGDNLLDLLLNDLGLHDLLFLLDDRGDYLLDQSGAPARNKQAESCSPRAAKMQRRTA